MCLISLWNVNVNSSIDTLIYDVMAPQEWNVVRDKVYQLMESAESIKHIIENRLNDEGIDTVMSFEEREFDQIFTNTMESFVNENNLYNQYFIYIGKPDGSFRGARVLHPNETELLLSARDASTNFTRRITYYTDDDNLYRDDNESIVDSIYTYDP